MVYWQHLTRQANEAHTRADYVDAQELSKKALACAEATFEDDFQLDAESAVSAVVVSYMSLAEVSISMKEWLQANDYFERGVHFLQSVIVAPNILPEHRQLIDHVANHIRFEWGLFQQTYGNKLAVAQRVHRVNWLKQQASTVTVWQGSYGY
ncbi:tetratricopeptide repeat protein [Marinomonas gallaica]|uniref:tetratricopeptide repeat protein n=1 Tax=Marinomonas gallaica TaxID=1806667 RepID=UPI003CE5A29D